MNKNSIPLDNIVYKTLKKAAQTSKVLMISGLPGVGKSLYINCLKDISNSLGKKITVIQWDIARKAFETPEILSRYPLGDGVIHNGVKLAAGKWLVDTLKNILTKQNSNEELLLIEAPLVGHRFIELAKIQEDKELESFLESNNFQIIVPIPSKNVRKKIEEDRKQQLADDAKTWTGAKPAVMLLLWKMICGIANEFGRTIPMDTQPPYDPEVYEFVFNTVLKHRHFIPLHVDDIFKISVANEEELHDLDSLAADVDTAN